MLAAFFALLLCQLIVGSYQQQTAKFLIGLGDSATAAGTAGGYPVSYPIVAANLLGWSVRNVARDGVKMSAIAGQLNSVKPILSNVTHVVVTIGGNDMGLVGAFNQIITKNNYTAVAAKVTGLKPNWISTYKSIKAAVLPTTKVYAIPYVDVVSTGNKIPNEADAHRLVKHLSETVKEAATVAGIGFIEAVTTAFAGHEIFSVDPYADDYFHPKNAVHANKKGYARVGEVVANYLRSE
ncbi:unnamed protein product [Adineta ricciae]|uniref:SGNH hydrolase-type esterase domain-containing protein n=1 Tax=Adineta ricciae TaxID=249248 RepID=A0A815R5G2_ADIRI|nr:unnamed protein product [Adineta ricciae]CAF1472041.1 unnamed protein product [Adineta ricciae]